MNFAYRFLLLALGSILVTVGIAWHFQHPFRMRPHVVGDIVPWLIAAMVVGGATVANFGIALATKDWKLPEFVVVGAMVSGKIWGVLLVDWT